MDRLHGPGIFNFHSNVRPVPLELTSRASTSPHVRSGSRLLAMGKPLYYLADIPPAPAIVNHADDKPAIVFVPSAKQAQLTAIDLLTYATADGAPRASCTPRRRTSRRSSRASPTRRARCRTVAAYGIGFLHEGLSAEEQAAVLALHAAGALQVLVVVHSMCWGLARPPTSWC